MITQEHTQVVIDTRLSLGILSAFLVNVIGVVWSAATLTSGFRSLKEGFDAHLEDYSVTKETVRKQEIELALVKQQQEYISNA